MTNRLAQCSSPYLLQHAENPVDWFPWGDEPFAKAVAQDKPVLVSIGYSACHWCHVMAHESFDDAMTAKFMNDHFVNIKVDREERPDVDAVYMGAVQLLTRQGGWPLNVFLTPSREPFFGGTYFPPEPRYGMASWTQVLQSIVTAWQEDRNSVTENASRLVEHLSKSSPLSQPSDSLIGVNLEGAVNVAKQHFDWDRGGFGDSPKFPNPVTLSFLLRAWAHSDDQETLKMVTWTLDRMAEGGIRDHVGGGFHRYSVDRNWVVPHFEKMLYDNALLGRLYTEAWQATGKVLYREVAEEIFDYVLHHLTSPEGPFYASEDADSEGEEGKFYVWTVEQIREEIGEPAASLFSRRYGLQDGGNFEGANILTIAASVEDAARHAEMRHDEAAELLAAGLAMLREARSLRPRPGLDTKVLTDWNGLMIDALAFAGATLGRMDYVGAAQRAADYFSQWAKSEGGDLRALPHASMKRRSSAPGFLSDYAALAMAFTTLLAITADARFSPRGLIETMRERFADGSGGFFDVSESEATELPVRSRDVTDGVVPSGTSVAAMAMTQAGHLMSCAPWIDAARMALAPMAPAYEPHVLSFAFALAAVDLVRSPSREIVLVLQDGRALKNPLVADTLTRFLPNVTRILATEDSTAGRIIPVLDGKKLVPGHVATAYVCENHTCKLPVTESAALAEQLRALTPRSKPG